MNQTDKKIVDLFIHEAFDDIVVEVLKQKTEKDKDLTINEIIKITEKTANDYGLKDEELLILKEMIIHKLF